jgi:hypothetical protein
MVEHQACGASGNNLVLSIQHTDACCRVEKRRQLLILYDSRMQSHHFLGKTVGENGTRFPGGNGVRGNGWLAQGETLRFWHRRASIDRAAERCSDSSQRQCRPAPPHSKRR